MRPKNQTDCGSCEGDPAAAENSITERITDVPFTQSESVAVAEVVPQERISERNSERTCEHSAHVPVPQVARQAIQVQER